MAPHSIKQWTPLILISSLGLFLELAVIRWLSAEVRLFSYFKNLPLLAAFLGLAIGFALVNKGQDYKKYFAFLLFIFAVLVLAVGRISSRRALAYPSSGEENLWFIAPLSYWMALFIFLGTVVVFFLLTMLLFIPLGQATGEEMARHKPVPAYIVNIASSLMGIWVFTIFSFWQSPPVVWLGLGIAGFGLYYYWRKALEKRDLALFAITLIGIYIFGQEAVWSPYQRLNITEMKFRRGSDGQQVTVGYLLDVQQVFYQQALNLSEEFVSTYKSDIPGLEDTAFAYDLPYSLAAPGSRALIVGSGMGNDVAAALRNGMGSVDAVEIDPVILRFGKDLHPEKPYDDPRVSPILDDARSFFVNSEDRYDLVAFGLLDSHTLLSSLSSVRLDSFVYTLESYRQVKDHLNHNGLVAVTFAANTRWLEERLGRMMAEVFGEDLIYSYHSKNGVLFIAGQLEPMQIQQTGLKPWSPNPDFRNLPLPTDDWPYLYMQTHRIPAAYWQALLVVGLLAILLMRRSFPEALRPDLQFWLLGAGFLLVEFISITRLALLFGTTWLVNALAISGVLLMILGANLIVLWRKAINLKVIYTLMFASLGLIYFFPLETLNQLAPLPRAASSVFLLSLPLFFSGMIFSELLRRAGETARPLASNLTGSVFGGVLEYTSIWWGVHSLYITALFVYALAFLVYLWQLRGKSLIN